MNFRQALAWSQRRLSESGIDTARLDSLILLEDNSSIDRAKILAEPEAMLTTSSMKLFKQQVHQRCQHTPLAYIRQKTNFYGRVFYIDRRVLQPRPESELLIEELDKFLADLSCDEINVIDIGTGSGCLIITAKLNHPSIAAYASDISNDSLDVARINVATLKAKVTFLTGNLISPFDPKLWLKPSIVMANLPYVPDSWPINLPAQYEPAIAIFGGPDGLRLYDQLFQQLSNLVQPPIAVICEAMPPQHQALVKLALTHGYHLIRINDFILSFSYSVPRPA